MRIRIEKSAWVGNARCAAIAPDLYPLDDDGYIAIEGFDVAEGQEQPARRARLPRTHHLRGRRPGVAARQPTVTPRHRAQERIPR